MRPKVKFKNKDSARALTDKEIEKQLARGAAIHNTALSIYQAKKSLGHGTKVPKTLSKLARPVQAAYALAPSQAAQVSDPGLDRSDETAVAINPRNLKNIVAGAVTFDGTQFTNSAYVSMDGGNTWQTVTALTNVNEGAAIAFDDSGNCYYATMQGGFNPCCVVSRDGGVTWSAPAAFGVGDKTAVAARGQIALCGFDRINTEACAFTLDGGMNWTVHDFTDSGLGTGPLVSYDQQYFYIVYAALDNNLKIYVSADQGQTWTGPNIIVPGNTYFSSIPGPLSYQGGALTSPGTNVAIDASGKLHVLYIASTTLLPMYTSSSDHGVTWSNPVNVNPERANDAHMFPCLSCNKDGDLLAGSMVYDQTLGKYSILRHVKTHKENVWKTLETDNGPWPAAGPSPGFRIGFGDYFDCDSPPECGISVMAWSETPNGQQPWQTWARILEPICEQEQKGRCPCAVELPDIPQECVSPCDPPWRSDEECLIWYETKLFRAPIGKESQNLAAAFLREYIEFRITYAHRLCLLGKQHGSLLYTVTLLPGEKVTLYHSDRFRRITSDQERFSVQTTFSQFLSIVHQARVTSTLDVLSDKLASVKSGGSVSVGGGLASLLGLPSGSVSTQTSVTDHDMVRVGFVSDQFSQSIVVSTYEDKENLDVTSRTLQNNNECRAVTYFVRKIVELYAFSTIVSDISYRIIAPNVPSDWHSINDLGWLPQQIQAKIKNVLMLLPKVGDVVEKPKPISLPTDGSVYDPELAHCCSCEPEREAAITIRLEKEKAEALKACCEAQLCELEARRRQLLLEKGVLDPFEPAPNPPSLPPAPNP